ncbi:MAG: 4Fe-4S binding protein [Acidobacteria bacterium]|nr:MAG: 4Fe-4S binding protein [Acidobacteriota bacterium]
MGTLQRVRVVWQGTFLVLFVWLLARLFSGDTRDFPYTVFHHADPLSGAGTVFGLATLPGALAWSAALLGLTLLFGRVFCGWVCPLGTLQQLSSWLLSAKTKRESREANRWRPWFAAKSWLLGFLLVFAVFGSLQTGLLDPLSLLARGLASGLWPILPGGRPVPGGWLAAALLLAILLASRWIPRLFCRALCPLGALLGVFARFSLFRIAKKPSACSSCQVCVFACQGADEPLDEHRVAECHVCLNCLKGCPEDALDYSLLPALPPAPRKPDLSRRHLVGSVLTGLVAAPLVRSAGGGRGEARPELIRPPGALAEGEFLSRCVKCSLCQQACPTGTIQPAIAQAGVEGFWTPVVVPRRGGCEFACTRCGEVCPTGAITRLVTARKTGYDGKPPVSIGTAFVDRGRCLPWAMATPCIVCEEMCPTDPKAIWLEPVVEKDRRGAPVAVKRPLVEPARCVGCGLCEAKCPVGEEAAIRVSSVGETRDPLNRMLLGA